MESMREKYETLQVGVLRDAAKRRGLKGISTLKKSELIELMLKEDEKVKRTADSLLRHRLVSLAASDAHSPLVRTTAMDELTRLLERRYGSGCPWLLLEENPARILRGEQVVWEEPIVPGGREI